MKITIELNFSPHGFPESEKPPANAGTETPIATTEAHGCNNARADESKIVGKVDLRFIH
jgi:hypothetical protein